MVGRSAFSLVEVLVATVVVVAGLIPVLTATQSTLHKAAYTDYHAFWLIRAKAVLEHFGRYRNEDLLALAGSAGTIDGATIESSMDRGTVPPEFARKLKNYTEELRIAQVSDGLLLLTARMTWEFPLDRVADRALEIRTIVADATVSFRENAREIPL